MKIKNIVVTVAALIFLVFILWSFANKEPETVIDNNSVPKEQIELTSTAKTYTSENLGITFSYEPKPVETFEVTVTEVGNKIYLHGTNESLDLAKSIEVFQKDRNLSLRDAIKQTFLQNHSEQDCFAVDVARDAADPRPEGYVFAEIAYPEPTDPNAPFWQNASKCPQEYARTNAVQFFMMNQNVAEKFVFIKLGQDSLTTDGTVTNGEENKRDWSASIRIQH